MIRMYRLQQENKAQQAAQRTSTTDDEKLQTMVPNTPPPPPNAARLLAEEHARQEAAAVKIQTVGRRKAAMDRVQALASDVKMQREEAEEAEKQRQHEQDSDVENVARVHYRLKTSTHLNGKLITLRVRVTDATTRTPPPPRTPTKGAVEGEVEGESDTWAYAVHVKIIEPKSRKVARICVEGEALNALCNNEHSLHEYMKALSNVEHPFHEDISSGGGNSGGGNSGGGSGNSGDHNVQQLAIMACTVFGGLMLFQSRAKGLLLLKMKKTAPAQVDATNQHSPSNLDRLSNLSVDGKTLTHSPMISPLADEKKSLDLHSSGGNVNVSPAQPSAPKASNGSPPTLDEVGGVEMEEEENELSLIELKQAAAKNWRPDSAVSKPNNVPKL
jgi:hypothetical protein